MLTIRFKRHNIMVHVRGHRRMALFSGQLHEPALTVSLNPIMVQGDECTMSTGTPGLDLADSVSDPAV